MPVLPPEPMTFPNDLFTAAADDADFAAERVWWVLHTRARQEKSLARHNAMLKMAEQCAPDQSWFDEDFTDLRHPGR